MEIRLQFSRLVGVFEERPAFLKIQFNFRDIVVSVFQAQDDFCIKVETRWRLIFK